MDKKELGSRIKEERKRAGLTQAELADRIGVKRVTVTKWEIGTCFPRHEHLSKAASALDISIKHLLTQYGASEIAEPTVLKTEAVEPKEMSDSMCLIILGSRLESQRDSKDGKKKAISAYVEDGLLTKEDAYELMQMFV